VTQLLAAGEFGGVFEQVAGVLAVCVVIGLLASILRQPLLVGLIVAGIVVGPEALGLVEASTEIELLAKIGISILLFVVGLKLDVRVIRTLGPVALATGLGQVGFTSLFGFLIAMGLGFDVVASLYIAVALTFSSTIIIVKLLSDKRELDDLHGRIAIGFLIVQDICVVLAMIALTAFDGDTGQSLPAQFGEVALKGAGLLVGIVLIARYVVPRVTHRLARSPELLVLGAVGYAVALASFALWLGFSEEVGAFLAGMSLASSDYREAISGRLTTLRDFLLVFFFIDLGANLVLADAATQLGPALIFSAFVLIGNPIIVMVIMGFMRYRKRVSFKAGLTVAQISEFSLILVALGVGLGHVGDEVMGLVTAVGLITIGVSTYLIYGSDKVFDRLEPLLRPFERAGASATIELDDQRLEPDVIVFGHGRLGSTVVDELRQQGDEVLVVDFDPRTVTEDRDDDVPVIYGDAEDPELPEQLPLASARWVVSTLRGYEVNAALLSSLRHHGFTGHVAVSVDDEDAAERLTAAGAHLVVRPFHVAAGPFVQRLHAHDRRGRREDG
jgi:Kef-type K+ transport system membrane component KefB